MELGGMSNRFPQLDQLSKKEDYILTLSATYAADTRSWIPVFICDRTVHGRLTFAKVSTLTDKGFKVAAGFSSNFLSVPHRISELLV